MKFSKALVFTTFILFSVSACKSIDLSKPVWTPSHVKAKQSQNQKEINNPKEFDQAYYMCESCLLLPKGQKAIRSDMQNLRGQLESIHVMGDKVQFQGWAADVGASRPVEKILIFANDRLVYEGSALVERLDVAKALGDGGVVRSGFSVVLDKSSFTGIDGKDASISVYAIGKENLGAKLPFKKG